MRLIYFLALTSHAWTNSEEERHTADDLGNFTIHRFSYHIGVLVLGLFMFPATYFWRFQYPHCELHSSIHVEFHSNFSGATIETESTHHVRS